MNSIPAPYNITNDNAIMLLFILNIVSIAFVFTMNGTNILERIKYVFYYGSHQTPFNARTHISNLSNALLYLQTILYSTIITIEYLKNEGLMEPAKGSPPYLGVFSLLFAAVIVIKYAGYYIINSILFAQRAVKEWQHVYFFTIKLLGFMFTPAIIAILFIPAISFGFVKAYLAIILVAYLYTVISNIIKIIFARNINILDIFLYLCTIEFLPALFVWKFILQLNEFITIKI